MEGDLAPSTQVPFLLGALSVIVSWLYPDVCSDYETSNTPGMRLEQTNAGGFTA